MSALKFYRLGFYPLRRDESVNIQLCTLYSKKQQQQQQQQTQKGYFWQAQHLEESGEKKLEKWDTREGVLQRNFERDK